MMESTPSLQPLAPLLCRLSCRTHSQIRVLLLNFEGANKELWLLETGTAPELTINRVSSFNLSPFPKNLTLGFKNFTSFLAYVQESS